MTLSFKQEIDGKPTYFAEKVIEGLTKHKCFPPSDYYPHCVNFFKNGLGTKLDTVIPKLHTIREDKRNRWKAGNKIHFVVKNRTPERFQFAPVVECVSVQRVSILPKDKINKHDRNQILVENESGGVSDLSDDQIAFLAKNDGFESVHDFWAYFNKPFTGKLIHWTDLKY